LGAASRDDPDYPQEPDADAVPEPGAGEFVEGVGGEAACAQAATSKSRRGDRRRHWGGRRTTRASQRRRTRYTSRIYRGLHDSSQVRLHFLPLMFHLSPPKGV